MYADIDECEDGDGPCDENAECTNFDGSFNCTCNDGYAGNGFCCQGMSCCLIVGHTCMELHVY